MPPWTAGWRMRRAAEAAGLGMADLIREMGVSKSKIGRWTHDHDDGKPPTPPELRRWAEICNVPLDWLQDGVGSVEEPVRTQPVRRQVGTAEMRAEALRKAAERDAGSDRKRQNRHI